MANDDDRRSRRGEERQPGVGGENRWDERPIGKQSLVDKEFGSTVRPGAFVQRRHGAPQSLIDATFGVLAPVAAPVQQRAAGEPDAPAAANEAGVHAAAAQGIATPSSRLPYSDTIQHLFGRHDISSVQAHTGPEAAASAHAMGASAYATGDHVVLGGGTDLHTVAHEAAHVVQQRAGVQLKGGIGAAGDAYEQHADAVADRVVAGKSAEDLLGAGATGGATHTIQRKEGADDGQILDHQAKLKNTDVEIPALEGAPQDPPGSGPARPALEGVVRRGSPAIPGDDPAPTHGGGR